MADKTILIVEDTRDLGRLLQTALATLGADLQVQVVPSAEEALLESPHRRYALAVVDVRLPGITGFELVSKMRARQKDLKVIVITGMLDAEYRQQAEKLQVNAFFTKPLEMSVFLDTVQRLLGLKLSHPALGSVVMANSQEMHLPELIAGLRQECCADAVVLLDENGRVVARAGSEQTGELENEGGPLVMSSLSAAQKVWRMVGRGAARSGQLFVGEKNDLLVMPVGEFALLILFPAGRSLLRLAAGLESGLAIRNHLLELLTQMGVPVQVLPPVLSPEALSTLSAEIPPQPVPAAEPEPAPAPVEETSADAEALGQLLSNPAQTLKHDDVDAFWQNASDGMSGSPLNPDALTYDQARQLGLAPEEDRPASG